MQESTEMWAEIFNSRDNIIAFLLVICSISFLLSLRFSRGVSAVFAALMVLFSSVSSMIHLDYGIRNGLNTSVINGLLWFGIAASYTVVLIIYTPRRLSKTKKVEPSADTSDDLNRSQGN
ncbi:MAG: hypothetical protein V1738_02885 [Patescibacteria group bacterium]